MKYINEGFECCVCTRQILPAIQTCRNHCPHCFASIHIDHDIPGDRSSHCKGIMLPAYYIIHNTSIDLSFVCIKCAHTHTNKTATDDIVGDLDHYIDYYRYYISTGRKPPLL